MPQFFDKAQARFSLPSLFGIDDILVAAGISAATSALTGSSAANKAAKASQNATDANVALQREILGLQQQNTATQRAVGNAALMQLAQKYGLPVEQVTQTANGLGVQTSPIGNAQIDQDYLARNPDLVAEGNKVVANGQFPDLASYLAWHEGQYGQEGRGSYLAPVEAPATTPAPQTEQAPPTPSAPGVTSASDVDSNGYYTGARPDVGPAPTYTAPTYRETTVTPLDVSLDKYQKSPDYEFQLDQGNKNILATASATGGLESGAALKALQEFGQNLALGDYSQWRNYTTGQYNTDRAYTANRDDAANAFNSSQALAKFGADQSNYQYGTNLSQSIYNTNRDYATSRYDQNTNALLGLAGYGQQANSMNAGALQNYGSNVGNAYFNNATTQGNSALASAGQFNNLLSNGTSALAYYYGNKPASGSSSYSGAGYVPDAMQDHY